MVVGLSTKSMAPLSVWTRRGSPPIWRECFCEPVKEEDWEEPLSFLRATALRIKMLESLVRVTEHLNVLKFATIHFQCPGSFLMAESRWFWFHLGVFISFSRVGD